MLGGVSVSRGVLGVMAAPTECCAAAAAAAATTGVRRRVAFAPEDTVREVASAQHSQRPAGSSMRRSATATERDSHEKLFDRHSPKPTAALRPLPFSRRGQLWRPHARSYCSVCGHGRLWYRDAHGYAGTPERPEGALGAACRCSTASDGAGSCHALLHAFEFHAVADSSCPLRLLDDKLLDGVLAWLCGRRGSRQVRMEYQAGAGARAARALAASCRRGRELVTAMRWVPGVHVDLFPHQVAALHRCCALEARRHSGRVCGGILCDEAGLGKTITALALMCWSRDPAVPRIPRGATLLGESPHRFYTLEANQVNELKLLPRDRRRTLMSKDYDPQSGGLRGRERKSTRRIFNIAYDEAAGYTGAGTFTRTRCTQVVGPVCSCSLLIVPEELESQWQRELKEKSNLRHRIVLRRDDVKILRRQAEATFSQLSDNITYTFPTQEEVKHLDVVVTTMERMGSRAGKRNGSSQNDGMREMSDGLALVHWARIIIDEGHELGGKGLSELAKVLGATLASATWVLSATPNRAGSGHFKQVDSRAITDFLQPGAVGKEVIVRTPKECIALPTLICQVEWLEFDTARQQQLDRCPLGCTKYDNEVYRSKMCSSCRSMPIEHRLVGRFAWIHSADTQQKVDERNNTIPEWMRLTDDLLLNANTKKAEFVVKALTRKHTKPSPVSESHVAHSPRRQQRRHVQTPERAAGAGVASVGSTSVGKTLVYSLYNSELYIVKKEMQRVGGWTDASSPYKDDFHQLEHHLQQDALQLGYTPESWPNWPVRKPEGCLPSICMLPCFVCWLVQRAWNSPNQFLYDNMLIMPRACHTRAGGESVSRRPTVLGSARVTGHTLPWLEESGNYIWSFGGQLATTNFQQRNLAQPQTKISCHGCRRRGQRCPSSRFIFVVTQFLAYALSLRLLSVCLSAAAVGEQMRIVRANSLQEFKLDPSIDVLLMDGVATVGHDLSCVSDVICLEAIPQQEVWDQLISRAYRMGADVRRPITVTTLAYRGSAEERLVPKYASQTVNSIGVSLLPASCCNVDGDWRDSTNDFVIEDWEEDWEQDTAAAQAAMVAVDVEPARSTSAPKRRKHAKSQTPRTPRHRIGATATSLAAATTVTPAASVVAGSNVVATSPAVRSERRMTGASDLPLLDGPMCVLRTQRFLGARSGHEFKLGPQGLGYYPTPQRLGALLGGLRERPQGRRHQMTTGHTVPGTD